MRKAALLGYLIVGEKWFAYLSGLHSRFLSPILTVGIANIRLQ